MNILKVEDLHLELDNKPIIRGLSLDIWEGHIHAIVGTNGAGKSTLVNTIMGLYGYEDFTGNIFYKDTSLKGLSLDERARLGITLAWQEPARFEGLRVKDFIQSSAKDKSIQRVKEVLNTVGLRPELFMMRAVDKTLSGGERKKVELASILAMEPDLAFLDEPDSGIDIESIERIFEVVEILKKKGTTVVFITHSTAVLSQADHAFLVCGGQIIDKGSPDKISKYFESQCFTCDVKDPKAMKEIPDDC